MDEKVLLKGKKRNTSIASIVCGLGVALIVLICCLNIWDPRYYFKPSLLGAAVCGIAVGVFIKQWLGKIELVVTNKRVYGCAAFGKRVDLPLDSISAVGTGWLNGIIITTASGAISFMLMDNKDELHKCISKLLMERQDENKKSARTIVKQEIPQSNAEELRKYKELLDMGAISKEEFDAKKKQLLGL